MILLTFADYIQSLPAASGYSVYRGFLPDTDNAIAVFPTGGFEGDFWLGYDEPTLQVRVRHTNPASAYSTAQGLYDALHGLHTTTISGQYIVRCRGLQSAPVDIGRDEADRSEYSLNFAIRVRNKNIHRL